MITQIIYTSESGDRYTQGQIKFEIVNYMSSRPEFEKLANVQLGQIMNIIYDMLMGIITWEHPSTVLDQLDEEDFEAIFARLEQIKIG